MPTAQLIHIGRFKISKCEKHRSGFRASRGGAHNRTDKTEDAISNGKQLRACLD